jgi:L-iditol 2-dehydrogenase
MQQLVLLNPGSLALRNVDPPQAGPGEVVIKIQAALTCGTDLKTYRRGHPKFPMPTPFGHEFSGDVWEVGPGVTRFQKGQAVLVAPTAPCGECPHCRRGFGNLCDYTMRTMMLGAFAEYIRVPAHIVAQNMFPKPESLSYMEGAVLEPLSCVVYGGQHLPLDSRDTVVIIGAGPIGLLHLMLARLRGAGRIVMVGRRKMRLATARRLGADVVVDETSEDVLDRVHHLTDGRGADVVIECAGHPQVWEKSIAMARRGGHVMLFGGCASGSTVRIPMERMLMDGLTVKGVFHFTPDAVRESYQLLTSGALQVSELITGIHPLSEFRRIFETLSNGEAIKLGIRPGF